MSKQDIVFDVDGVLLLYMETFTKYMQIKHNINYNGPKLPRPIHFTMHDLYPGLVVKDYINEMAVDPIFSTMAPLNGAINGLNKIAQKFNIHAVTSAGKHQKTLEYRLHNLQKVFNWKDEWPLHVIGLGQTKIHHLQQFDTGTIFIDDHIKNIKDAEICGLNAIWFKESPNHYLLDNEEWEARQTYPIVHGWNELLLEIEKESGISLHPIKQKDLVL